MSAIATAANALVCFAIAYVVVLSTVRGRRALALLAQLPWAIPATAIALGLAATFDRNAPAQLRVLLVGTFWILPLAYFIRNIPIVTSAVNLGLNAQLQALEQNGTATVLAEPQLSTRSGYKATFHAGGEIPYSVASVNGVTVQFKPYGIRLDIEHRVARSGAIRAVIDSEVSSIDSSVSTTNGPALLTRRTRTEFNVKPGETIVLAGLLQRTNSTDTEGVPFLGNIPILGALFRSKRFQNKETELVVLVTPHLVDSSTPALKDRIERVHERLKQNLGDAPYLSDPLQPVHATESAN